MTSTSTTTKTDTIIGIDLGTTYCCIGVWQNGRVEVIANDQGNRTTPSYVAFTDDGILIGDAAKSQTSQNPKNTVFDVKRLIGRDFTDPIVQADAKMWPFTVKGDKNNKPVIEVSYKGEQKTYYPEQISAMLLGHLKKIAENYLGHEVTRAVITVPAYFNDSQRQATKDAGLISGLTVERIINEPTAAAIAYGFDKISEKEQTIQVFDLGGGTFDVSILALEDGTFEVKSTSGDTHLGGEDFDNRLVDYCIDEAKKKYKITISKNKAERGAKEDKALRRLRTACEKAKRTLSTATTTTIEVDTLYEGQDFSIPITRAKFNDLCEDLFKKCLDPVMDTLKVAKYSKEDINQVVIVGGSSRIPRVKELLQNFYNGKELCQSVNPDEAIAYGAAVQGAILSGANKSSDVLNQIVLLDVSPLNLGVETSGAIMQVIVPRGTTIPCKKSDTFTTYSDNQPGCTIKVFEGQRQMTKDNHCLGTFNLNDIPPMKRGVPKIEITYDIDANGILTVSAKETSSGKTEKITIKNDKGRLTKEQIEKMVAEAEEHKKDDEEQKARVEALNSTESYIYNWTGQLENEEIVKKLEGIELEPFKTSLKEMKTWIETNRTETKEVYEAKLKECEELLKPITDKLGDSGNMPGMPGGMSEGMPDMAGMGGSGKGGMPDMNPEQMAKMAEMYKNMDPEQMKKMTEMFSKMQAGQGQEQGQPDGDELDEDGEETKQTTEPVPIAEVD